jgi:hypothetical protein
MVELLSDCPGPPGGRLSALSVFLCKSGFYGAFVWARRALNSQKRWFPARADELLCTDVTRWRHFTREVNRTVGKATALVQEYKSQTRSQRAVSGCGASSQKWHSLSHEISDTIRTLRLALATGGSDTALPEWHAGMLTQGGRAGGGGGAGPMPTRLQSNTTQNQLKATPKSGN